MKKKLIASLSILAVFAFAIAAFAYTQNVNLSAPSASSSLSKDSCPMKMKGHEGSGEHGKMSCCKKHDGQHAEGQSCDCCGDSCPMKKGEGAAATAASTSATDSANCCDNCDDCDNCDCCKGKTEASV